jgi:hypothetical protein
MDSKPSPIVPAILLGLLLAGGIIAHGYFTKPAKSEFASVSTMTDGQKVGILSVSGDGKAMARPDMVTVSASFSETANTSAEALDKVNRKMSEIINVAKANGVPDKDIQTSGLSIYPEYEYGPFGGTPKLKGQRASESVSVIVRGVDEKAEKASRLIDQVSAIENVQLGGISFDIENKTALFTQAREAAFSKAKQKAEELAKLSGVKLTKPVTITDNVVEYSPPIMNYAMAERAMAPMVADAVSTPIQSGELSVTVNLSVGWGME